MIVEGDASGAGRCFAPRTPFSMTELRYSTKVLRDVLFRKWSLPPVSHSMLNRPVRLQPEKKIKSGQRFPESSLTRRKTWR